MMTAAAAGDTLGHDRRCRCLWAHSAFGEVFYTVISLGMCDCGLVEAMRESPAKFRAYLEARAGR